MLDVDTTVAYSDTLSIVVSNTIAMIVVTVIMSTHSAIRA